MISRIYLKSVVLLLVLTACSKLVMALGSAPVLREPGPAIFDFVSNRSLLLLASALELAVAYLYLKGKSATVVLASVAGLASVFVAYRICLWLYDFHGYCDCLGSLTDTLNLNQQQAIMVSEGILAYLLVGSYALLIMRAFKLRQYSQSSEVLIS
jgi:hypothetical protein